MGYNMSTKIITALEKQINLEISSAYLYLAMSAKMNVANYPGYSSWLFKQYREEMGHAEDFISYALRRELDVNFGAIEQPVVATSNPLEIAKLVLEHEKIVTKSIFELYELARNEKDYTTELFVQKYIEEQAEEEESAKAIIDKLNFIGESHVARYALDKELGARQ